MHTFCTACHLKQPDGMKLCLVFIARQIEQLTVSVLRAVYFCVPTLRVEEDAVCFATESSERVQDHYGVT